MLKDKNLLVLSHTYNSFIKDPVEILAKNFNKVYVLVRHNPLSELGNIIPLKFFKNRAKYSKRYLIDLTNKPENVEVIPVSFFYLPIKDLYLKAGPRHLRKVMQTIKKRNIKFDLIHAHFLWSAGYVGAKLSQKYNKPLVLTGHGYDVYKLPYSSKKFMKAIQSVLEQADKILTVSDENRKILNKLGAKDVRVLPNGYSKELFYFVEREKALKKLDLPRNRKIILTIGNLEEVKGYEYLIKAIKIVSKKEPSVLCLHIGSGSLEGQLKDLVTKLNIEKNFKFLGRKPHDKLVDYFGASEFFVSSSLSEGNPTVMFESLGCGKPYIGTKVGGVPDIINSPKYGLLCQPKDEQILADNIYKAIHKKWNTNEILKYSKQYSWDNVCKNILNIYERLLK